MDEVKLLQAGEQGLVIEFGNEIHPETNRLVHNIAQALSAHSIIGMLEVIPTYRSLLIYFDPLQISRVQLGEQIQQLIGAQATITERPKTDARVVRIPVCYGGEFGPDLAFVAQYNQISIGEVIQIHSSTPYQVYMLGFTPGFPYLGGMSEKIATPRLEKPRVKIPAGSVGIAGKQTGFYPVESPGGWQLIGRTPINAFDANNPQPFAFAAGDYLQFVPVSPEEFFAIRREVEAGAYTPEFTTLPKGE